MYYTKYQKYKNKYQNLIINHGGSYSLDQDWFYTLFGFREMDYNYKEIQSKFTISNRKLKSQVNNQVYLIGDFSNPSVAELKHLVKNSYYSPGIPIFRCKIVGDIFLLHSRPENRGALFQAASQFNCLEFIDPEITPEDGVTIYSSDPTQGPACAIPTGPATVYRNYFFPFQQGIGQTRDRQINNLESIQQILLDIYGKRFFRVKNGYTVADKKDLVELNQILANPDLCQLLIEQLKVGFLKSAEVVFRDRYNILGDPDQLVSQLYVSALSIAYAGNNKDWYPLAEIILNAAYEATIYAGLLNYLETENNKVYLTLLGGGAFGNPPNLIVNAIKRAVNISRQLSLPLEIICGFYNQSNMSPILVYVKN